MKRSNPPVGMDDDERDIYTVAQFVRMPGDRIEPFLKTLAMCGFEVKRKPSPLGDEERNGR